MRLLSACLAIGLSVQSAVANTTVNQLVNVMGVPALIQAFSEEGVGAGETINQNFLSGQGGDVWAETVRRLYDPARLEVELTASLAEVLDADVASQALLFFESEIGAKVIALEVAARQAMQNADLEATARAAGAQAGETVVDFLALRNLIERNTTAAITAQTAFFAGLVETSGRADVAPDIQEQRSTIMAETESWLRGYYALIQSPLSADEVAIYTAFWDTDVGKALDDAMFAAFGASYASLSYGLGQAAGRLLPQNEL
ncbi:MAG: hypothetical protein AAF214_11920 [Pseudomonadota bacterium]